MKYFTHLEMQDPRWKAMSKRLFEFCPAALTRLWNALERDEVCLDTFNYDNETQKFCPLAIMVGLPEKLPIPSDVLVELELSKLFNPVNILKGTPGTFYTTNRREDLMRLVRCLIEYKAKCGIH